MVRTNNTKREVILISMTIVENAIHRMNKALTQEINNTGTIDPTFKASRDAEAKTQAVKIIKTIRWLKESYFGISGTPQAYTDAQMILLEPDVLTHEED